MSVTNSTWFQSYKELSFHKKTFQSHVAHKANRQYKIHELQLPPFWLDEEATGLLEEISTIYSTQAKNINVKYHNQRLQ